MHISASGELRYPCSECERKVMQRVTSNDRFAMTHRLQKHNRTNQM